MLAGCGCSGIRRAPRRLADNYGAGPPPPTPARIARTAAVPPPPPPFSATGGRARRRPPGRCERSSGVVTIVARGRAPGIGGARQAATAIPQGPRRRIRMPVGAARGTVPACPGHTPTATVPAPWWRAAASRPSKPASRCARACRARTSRSSCWRPSRASPIARSPSSSPSATSRRGACASRTSPTTATSRSSTTRWWPSVRRRGRRSRRPGRSWATTCCSSPSGRARSLRCPARSRSVGRGTSGRSAR